MLNELQAIFEKEFKRQKSPLKKIESSCCKNVDTLVFYFDQITEKFFKHLNVGNFLCSVDIVHFLPRKSELILAELTSFEDYAKSTGKKTDSDCLNYIRNELLCNKLRNKIIHSIFTLVKIADYYNLDKTFFSYFFDTKKLSIKNYLVIDLTPEQYIFIELACIDKLERHKKDRIEGEISIIDCPTLEKRLKQEPLSN